MCQLLLINAANSLLNRVLASGLLPADSMKNQDGTGVASITLSGKHAIWKTELAASRISNLGTCLNFFDSEYPLLCHVRAASPGIKVDDLNAHPFRGERFILAHNGRLYKSDERPVQSSYYYYNQSASDDSSGSDSLNFLTELEKTAALHPELTAPQMISDTMKNFMGKFALLILDKSDNSFYVCRGKSADLHIAKLYEQGDENSESVDKNYIGFVVNTKKDVLEEFLPIMLQTVQTVSNRYILMDNPHELEKDSIYKVDGVDLVKVGDCVENPVIYKTYPVATQISKAASNLGAAIKNDPVLRSASRMYDFISSHLMTIGDLDKIIYAVFGKPFASCNASDFEYFVDKIIPVISAPKVKRKTLKRAGNGIRVRYYHYRKLKINFPWMLNTDEEIKRLVEELEKAAKENK